jgi:hypothetical protein
MTLPLGKVSSKAINDELAALAAAEPELPSYTVAQLPTPSANAGKLAYCSNGAAGSPGLVYCNGTAWKVVAALGATAATS